MSGGVCYIGIVCAFFRGAVDLLNLRLLGPFPACCYEKLQKKATCCCNFGGGWVMAPLWRGCGVLFNMGCRRRVLCFMGCKVTGRQRYRMRAVKWVVTSYREIKLLLASGMSGHEVTGRYCSILKYYQWGIFKLLEIKILGHSEKKIFNKHFQGGNSELNSLDLPRKTP